MSQDLTEHFSTRSTPQSQPIPDSGQVKNSAGGYAWEASPFRRLLRFLLLGTEGGTHYIGERELTIDNATNLLELIQIDGVAVVATVVDISVSGRAPKNDPAIFALALASAKGDDETRRAAYDAVSKVCRIGTHLFMFFRYRKAFGGRGRGFRRAMRSWYADRDPRSLAFQLLKYQQRDGVSHADVLKLARPNPETPTYDSLFRWAVHGQLSFDPEDSHDVIPEEDGLVLYSVGREKPPEGFGEYRANVVGGDREAFELVEAFENAQAAEVRLEIIQLIEEYGLTREMVPTKWQSDPKVQGALLRNMPMMATVRSLGPYSASGLIAPMSQAAKMVVDRLGDADALKRSRIHPVSLLVALLTYRQGAGVCGSLSWVAVPQVIDALTDAFYASFENIEPTGGRWILGVDVSGSMQARRCAGAEMLRCDVGAAVMAMVTARTEENFIIMGFSHEFVPLPITAQTQLSEAMEICQGLPFARTDCSLPFTWAQANRIEADSFVVYTDSETWHGTVHPCQALRAYREHMGIRARSAIVAMEANEFSIADPNDAGMMDFVGFDTQTPQALAEFMR